MALTITINSKYLKYRTCFKGGSGALGSLTPEQLLTFAIICRKSRMRNNLRFFDMPLPSLTDLVNEQTAIDTANVKANTLNPVAATPTAQPAIPKPVTPPPPAPQPQQNASTDNGAKSVTV